MGDWATAILDQPRHHQVCDVRNTDENGPGLLEGGGCPRTVLLRYPGGGHCCFATGLRADL